MLTGSGVIVLLTTQRYKTFCGSERDVQSFNGCYDAAAISAHYPLFWATLAPFKSLNASGDRQAGLVLRQIHAESPKIVSYHHDCVKAVNLPAG